jgi:hypothetical protein
MVYPGCPYVCFLTRSGSRSFHCLWFCPISGSATSP